MDHHELVIETPRLVLRAATPADAVDLFECFKDGEVMRYWDTLPHQTLQQTQTWVQKMIEGNGNGTTDFVICLKAAPQTTQVTGSAPIGTSLVQAEGLRVIGKAGVWRDDEIGFLLHREFWGKGLASEILQVLLDLFFDVDTDDQHNEDDDIGDIVDAAMNKTSIRQEIVADVDPRNAASLGILKKMGFEVYDTKEKTFMVGDKWVDSVYLSLKRDVWLRKRDVIGTGGGSHIS